MNKDIININYKGQYHGYRELYISNILLSRTNWKNNMVINYGEYHIAKQTRFYII